MIPRRLRERRARYALEVPFPITREQAATLRADWEAALRSGRTPVLSGGVTVKELNR